MNEAASMIGRNDQNVRSEIWRPNQSICPADGGSGEICRDRGIQEMNHHADDHIGDDRDDNDLPGPSTSRNLDHYNVADIANSRAGSVSTVPLENPIQPKLRCCLSHNPYESRLVSAGATITFLQHDDLTIIHHYASTTSGKDTPFGIVPDERAYMNPPFSNSPLNLSNLSLDVKIVIMNSIDRVLATVLGLTCTSLYAAYWRVYHNLKKHCQKVKLTDGLFLKCPNCDLVRYVKLIRFLSDWPVNCTYNEETGKWAKTQVIPINEVIQVPSKAWKINFKNIMAAVKHKVKNNKTVVKLMKITRMKKKFKSDKGEGHKI